MIEEVAVKGQITQQVDANGMKSEITNAENTKLDAYGSEYEYGKQNLTAKNTSIQVVHNDEWCEG